MGHKEEKEAFWRSEKGQARSKRGKANRSKMGAVHTIGTRSLANVHHDLGSLRGTGPRDNVQQRAQKIVGNHNCERSARIAGEHPTRDTASTKGKQQKTSQWYLQCAHGAEKHAINQSCSKAAKIGGEGLRGAITSTNGTIKKSKVTTTTNETIQVGKEVFLQATTRPYSHVAKATVEGEDLSELIGGVQLGSQCYKVVIYSAICRDANLFRSHKNLRRIGDAVGHSIAWPSQWCKKFHQSRSLGK